MLADVHVDDHGREAGVVAAGRGILLAAAQPSPILLEPRFKSPFVTLLARLSPF